MLQRLAQGIVRPFHCSQAHLNIERGNGMMEIAGTALENFTIYGTIPVKIMQIFTSTHAVVRQDTFFLEKLVHLSQMLVATAELGLTIAIFYEGESCNTLTSTLCKSLTVAQLAYKGLLLLGWIPSENSPPQTEQEAQGIPRV